MSDQSHFWSNTADKYSRKPVPNQEVYEKKLKLTQELLNSEMKILEIGCGTGTTALIHAPLVSQIIATDFSKKMIQIAKHKAVTQNISNIEFKEESVQEMSYSKNEFDVIMAHSILHLVENKEEVLAKIYHYLKPGGYFISSTGCVGGVLKLFKPIWYIGYKLGKLPFINFFTKEDFVKDVTNSGLKIEARWDPTKVDIFLIGVKP
ncbi:bifunctional 2-polyprenyl-6-hydroxyphenol methylase/3-demethylubiquinol 3-O-methyltransferase UbiG [Halobacteriovorax sp. HLS]|uniref:class I SAM-dependent methyltransferase n=1 Tax=Halobacteriovorax sp. HLS TaxID=2234000 RepID=UPI000FDBF2F2|nr:class I SAM-dependent methyltransferase [Halobacteriovorax sp. HLS]